MPIDPASGLDPETGLVGLKETHQPTGAIGAVMSYLNADKSRQISEALQQHRAASAQMEQQQADEYAARQERDNNVRRLVAQLGDNPSLPALRNAYLKGGGDPEKLFAGYRAELAAGGRLGSAEILARAKKWVEIVRLGGTMDEADRRAGGDVDPNDLELIHALAAKQAQQAPTAAPAEAPAPKGLPFLAPQQGPEAPPPPPEGSQPLPVPAGRAAALQGAGAKGQAAAASITAKTSAEVGALKALAEMRRMRKEITSSTNPTKDDFDKWERQLIARDEEIRKLTFDKYGDQFDENPERERQIAVVKKAREEIQAKIDAKKRAASAASTGTGTQSPSPFAAGTFDTTTPGGSTTAAGGTSSHQTVDRTIKLPKLSP